MYDAGVAWTLCEHVSVAIAGWADYVFEGPKGPITQRWTPGCHNVERDHLVGDRGPAICLHRCFP
ncbi:hypothetical protein H0274_11685 [Altererythrobacter sp. CC-YST694]|uniref:sarcosine oxidase subunit delta n=1 Tax=Altererythrobacter sp. CC-YST694 TaxID=2755038 RepID=UPI001D010311|nr:sarcosine oxidase subunit delta [Altererythrobacter sp. CC-YST694]MCB5425922.1 hypothetical protein [Altererythrobacter sp. CC-YST694]